MDDGFAWVRLACVTANVLTFLTMQRAAAAGTSDLLRSEAPTAWRSPGPPGAVKLAETAAVGRDEWTLNRAGVTR